MQTLRSPGALLLAALSLVIAPAQSVADDGFAPDYYVVMSSCKMMGAPLYPVAEKDDPLGVVDTQGLIQSCERKPKKRLSCVTSFMEKDAKPVAVEYRVDVESATLMIWKTENWADYLIIDPSKSSAILTVRMISENVVATKICHGMFLTSDEFEALSRRADKEAK